MGAFLLLSKKKRKKVAKNFAMSFLVFSIVETKHKNHETIKH